METSTKNDFTQQSLIEARRERLDTYKKGQMRIRWTEGEERQATDKS